MENKYLNPDGLKTVLENLKTVFSLSGHTHTKSQVGLGNVDNTADANKSVKYATSAGSATSATKATQDGAGDEIARSYRKRRGHISDFNAATVEGVYTFGGTVSNGWNASDYGTLEVYNTEFDGASGENGVWLVQVAYNTSGKIYSRYRTNASNWSSWANYAFTNSTVSNATNAGSATKLAASRNIGVSGAADASVSFNGSANAIIPLNSVKETYLTWGGRNVVGDISPIDAAMSYIHSANRGQFCKPAGVTVEYSTDNGSTWIDYGLTDAQKTGLLSGIDTPITIGKHTNGVEVTDRLRVTLNASKMEVYTALKKVIFNISSNGAMNSKVLVEYSKKGSESTFVTNGTYAIDGWSGWNSIPIACSFGGGDNQTSNTAVLRFTFSIGSKSSNTNYSSALQVLNIMLLGTTYWSTPSTMARTGHIYTYGVDQSTTFPADVATKTSFIEGGTALSNKYQAKGSYASSTHKHTKADISDFPSSLPANGGNSDTVGGFTVKTNVPADAKFTDTGTLTGIKMNGASKGTSGVVDLGTVLTGGSQTSTSSADGGSNVYTFSDGSTITVKNGSKGSAGTTPTVKVASGTKIAAVGTPSVTAATSGTTTTFTFNYLKGQKGDKGDPGVNATTTAVATASANGLMSASDKSKLDGITTKLIVASTEPTANTNDIWYQEY